MKCLIIAAGMGTRLRPRGACKPLVPLIGIPLIERVIRAVAQGGISDFVVVTGYNGPKVRDFLDQLMPGIGASVEHIKNDEWQKPNGLSVLKARAALDEPFLLTMSDHLFDPTIVADISKASLATGEAMLAVDYNITNPIIDLADVTRVSVADGRIAEIGKGIAPYNAFDTGIFHATPALFDAIEESSQAGDVSLSGGMKVLAAAGRARVFDIGGRFWFDVDEPEEVDTAELMLHQEVIEV